MRTETIFRKVKLTLREKKIFVSIQILRVNWIKSSLCALVFSLQKNSVLRRISISVPFYINILFYYGACKVFNLSTIAEKQQIHKILQIFYVNKSVVFQLPCVHCASQVRVL